MKTILLYASEDPQTESRLQAGLDLARAFEAHLTCLQVTPFQSFVAMDPFGGVYALPTVMEEVTRVEAAHRARIEERLAKEGVSWDWRSATGNPGHTIPSAARLSDIVVISLPGGFDAAAERELAIAGDVLLMARSPVLAVPHGAASPGVAGSALVAWNGAVEAGYAIRAALPMIARASSVHIVTVCEEKSPEFPATDAGEYLSRHGIASELHEWPRGENSVAEALIDAGGRRGAAYVVLGGYGHSRMREAVLGGTTREMLRRSPLPLILAH